MDQNPLRTKEIELEILNLLPYEKFDLIITHSQSSEYTKHLRSPDFGLPTFDSGLPSSSKCVNHVTYSQNHVIPIVIN